MKEGRRMLSHEELSSSSGTRIPDKFMESELAKNIIQDHQGSRKMHQMRKKTDGIDLDPLPSDSFPNSFE